MDDLYDSFLVVETPVLVCYCYTTIQKWNNSCHPLCRIQAIKSTIFFINLSQLFMSDLTFETSVMRYKYFTTQNWLFIEINKIKFIIR